MELATGTDVKYTIIRPCVTYGDTRILLWHCSIIWLSLTLIARVLNGKPIVRWNEGNNRCNMMRVEDFCGRGSRANR